MLQKNGSQPAKCDGKSQSCGPNSGYRRWCGAYDTNVLGNCTAVHNCCCLRPIPAAPSEFNSPENLILSNRASPDRTLTSVARKDGLCVFVSTFSPLFASACHFGAAGTAPCLGTLHPPIPKANGVSISDCWSGTRPLVRNSRRGRCLPTDSPRTCNCPSPRLP